MPDWKATTLGDFVSLQRGHDLPQRERRPGKIPVVGSGGVAGFHDKAIVFGPGITIGRAANIGVPTFTQEDFWPLNTTLYVTDYHGNDVRFAYYLLQTLDLTGFNSGSVQPMLNRNYIRSFPIRVPDVREQQAVVAVLGALDDKIAVDNDISTTSLILADSIFDAASIGMSFGPETFGAVASVYGGGTPRTSEPSYWDGGIAWTTPTDVTALGAPYMFKTSRTITDSGLANCASQVYPCGSILMTSRATIGAFAVPQMPTAVNQGFIVVVPPQDDLRWWLFHEMRSRIDEMLSMANGSTFLELSRRNFKAMSVRVPPPDVLKRFDAKVGPLHRRAAKAVQETAVLVELRDTLLPKLISGAIRVRDAEKVVEDVT